MFIPTWVRFKHFQPFWEKKIIELHLNTIIVNLVEVWTWEVVSKGQFVFPSHEMFFQPQHGTIILFPSAWLQHCTMPVLNHNDSSTMPCIFENIRWTIMWLDNLIYLASIKFWMNLWEGKILLEGEERKKIGPLEGALCFQGLKFIRLKSSLYYWKDFET